MTPYTVVLQGSSTWFCQPEQFQGNRQFREMRDVAQHNCNPFTDQEPVICQIVTGCSTRAGTIGRPNDGSLPLRLSLGVKPSANRLLQEEG